MSVPNLFISRRGILLGIGLAVAGGGYWRFRSRKSALPNREVRSIDAVVQPHLAKAQREIELAIETEWNPIDRLFADAKGNSHRFAEDALGWGSKRR